MMNNKKEIGIYLHIPFCLCKCSYCDFPSFSGKSKYYEEYVKALVNEINSYYDENLLVKTIFIGGGTPTVLPFKLIEQIFNSLYKYNIDSNCEITIEANPETLSYNYLRNLKNIGVNRISIGLQSTDNSILKSIGRVHNFEKFYEEFNNCINVGISNINVDLMFSLPNQTVEIYRKSLETIADLSPTHISSYSLILEEGTRMFKDYNNGKITLPNEDYDRELYELTFNVLSRYGYDRYEISNYSKNNYNCKHNLSYWKQVPYLGFGLGAHSFFNNTRYNNTYDFDKYLENKDFVEDIEQLSQKNLMEEFMFLGLRITDGISISEFSNKFSKTLFHVYGKEIDELINQELLYKKNDRLRLTLKGIDLSNYVFSKFIL